MNRAVTVRSVTPRLLSALIAVAVLGLQACTGTDPIAPSGVTQLPAGPAFSVDPAPVLTTNTNVWNSFAPMPTPRTAAAIELVSNQIYLMGGWDGTAASAKVEAYDRATNTWITKPSLPAARYEGDGAAEIGGWFYVPGGKSSLGVPTKTLYVFNKTSWSQAKLMPAPSACGTTLAFVKRLFVSSGCDGTAGYKNNYYIYNKANNTWTVATPSQSAHAFGAAGQVSGKAGLVGGYDSTGHVTAEFEVYDTLTATWTSLAPMPTPRARMWGRQVNGLFYVIGGVDDNGNVLDVVEVYNPSTDTWTAQSPLPTPRSGLGVMDIGHGDPKVQAIGGTDASGAVVGTNEMLTPGNIWAPRKAMPSAVYRFASGTVGANTYMAGGISSTGAITTFRFFNGSAWTGKAALPLARYDGNGLDAIGNLLYVPGGASPTNGLPTRTLYAYSISGNTWSSKALMPVASGCGATGAINGKLYVTTGCDGVSFRTLLSAYTPSTNTWAAMAPSTQSHVFPTAGVYNGKLYVAGGLDSNGVVTGTLEIYDPATNTWSSGSPMPTPRYHAAGRVVNGYLVVIGGLGVDGSSLDTVEIYNPNTDTWETGVSMNGARNSMGAGTSGLQLFLMGGADASGNLLTETNSYTP